MIRTFIALNLPEQIKDEITDIIHKFANAYLDGVNWVTRENLHITFQFIGNTKPEDIPEISIALTRFFEKINEFEFYAPQIQIIPGKDPKIIWIGLKTENTEIFKISKKLKSFLRRMDYKIDSRKLKPHITLGRIKKRLPEKLIKKMLNIDLNFGKLKVNEVAIYKSTLTSSGPVYEEIGKIEF